MQKFWIVNQIDSTTAEILLYGYIGSDEVTASDFVRELKGLEKQNSKINIRINSGGGSVFDGFAIFNAIKQSKSTIDTYVDGLAASMGSVIALAGKNTYMSNVARFMTHKASGAVFGNADEMRQNAELLEGLENTICAIYAAKTGLSVDDCRKKYVGSQDKWFTAKEALAEKLIDGIYDATNKIEAPANTSDEKSVWNFYNSKFENILKIDTSMKVVSLSAEQLTKLNLKADSDAAVVDTTINDLVAKAAKVDTLATQLSDANTAKKTAEDALTALKASTEEAGVDNLLATALKDRKITKELSATFKTKYKNKEIGFDALKSVVDAMPKYVSIVDSLDAGDAEDTTEEDIKLWDKLDKEDKLENLKATKNDQYKKLFKAKFGKEPS